MMIEFARELQKDRIVRLGHIAGITGISEKYLAQLTLPLKKNQILIGVSGKKGGYMLARPADQISIGEIVASLVGPMSATDCVRKPEICLNSPFCEARLIWAIMSDKMQESLDGFKLSDMIDRKRIEKIKEDNRNIPLLFSEKVLEDSGYITRQSCPVSAEDGNSD
jgi:Rrf2 family protein